MPATIAAADATNYTFERGFTFLRVYGPQEPIFDGTWMLPDIEEVDW